MPDYNFLSLTNSVLYRVNETPLTSSNFSTATGVHSDVKNAVNMSINDINTQTYEKVYIPYH